MQIQSLLLALLLVTTASAQEPLWGPIELSRWNITPCIEGRLATEDDVREGRAAFYLKGDPSTLSPVILHLPRCAILRDQETGREIPVIVIQAEKTPKMTALGYRPLAGGNGICTMDEVEFVTDKDERMKAKTAEPDAK